MIDLRWSFCGEQREAVRKRETGLRAEDGVRAGAGAVAFELALFEHEPEQLMVLDHGRFNPGAPATLA